MIEVDYMLYGIKMFYISFSILFVFCKTTSIKFESLKNKILLCISCFIIAVICSFIKKEYQESIYSNFILYLSICILLKFILKKNAGYIMISSVLSYAISYVLFLIAIILGYIVNSFIKLINPILILIMICTVHFLIIKAFFNIKRFKNGFSFFKNIERNNYIDIAVFSISSIILYLYSLITYNSKLTRDLEVLHDGENITKYVFINFIVFGMIMLIMIQKTITLSYKQSLLANTIKDYEKTIKEKDEKIQRLSDEKFKINKLNHEFYNRQKSLELKVEKALKNMNFEISNEFDLGDKILELSKEYTNKVIEIKNNNELPKTDIEEIDDMFTYMQSECTKNGIEFILQINGNIHYLVNNIINKTRLVTLIGDHLKDAIIAINYSDNKYKSILAILGIKDDCYEFCIYDSGIEFEIQTFNKLGLEPATTHKESGGTGIGFITTFETLKETDASLIIEEKNKLTENKYTKSIKFRFDNKKELKIISYRAKDIKNNRFIIE